jgi:hypothetical protein
MVWLGPVDQGSEWDDVAGDVLLTYGLYIYTSARGADLIGGAVDGDNNVLDMEQLVVFVESSLKKALDRNFDEEAGNERQWREERVSHVTSR